MQATPMFLGACALVSVAGVVSGTAIDTNPIQRGGIGMNEIVRPSIDLSAELSDQPALPDHYALSTPEGKVEVAELSTRGLYAQRRFGWREAIWTPPPEPDWPPEEPLPETVEFPTDEAVRSALRAEVEQVAEAPEDSDTAPQGGARLIDVEQALAGG